ncbi:MAG: NAD(P)/FAD-dependent oxidoreductase [bacterium]
MPTSVLIIGGGVIGLCTAYYLWKNGVKVEVVEKGEVGAGCSSRNAGLIVPSHIIPLAAPGIIAKGVKWLFNPQSPFYVKPQLNWEFYSWLRSFRRACSESQMQKSVPMLNQLLQASAALFRDLSHSEIQDFGYKRKGLIMLYKSDRGLSEGLQLAEMAMQKRQAVSIFNREQLHQRFSNIHRSVAGGIYFHQDAHINPEVLLNNLGEFLKKNGVQIHTQTGVQGWEKGRRRISNVLTDKGAFSADEFVLAGGAWSPAIVRDLSLKLSLQAGKGYSVDFPLPNRQFEIPLLLGEARMAVTPLEDRLRVAGTMELSGIDLSVNPRRVQAMLRILPDYLPALESKPIEPAKIWAGLRPCTPDGLPLLGRIRNFKNLMVATGHAMLGISLAPITGKLVADVILARPPEVDLTALRVERFN